jgi:peptidoglycan/xylan/chitin deacetylase (PgdA/CDA1 family)
MNPNRIVAILVALTALFTGVAAATGEESTAVLEPLPDKVVVLTFDDSVRSHYTVARPILQRYGFGATFFITEGFTFAWPGNAIELEALPILQKHGMQWARRGGFPEYPRGGERGFPYEPGLDHPLLIPSAGIPRPGYTFEEFVETLEGARDGEAVVLQFHGVPEGEHPWVHVSRATFERFMAYLAEHDFQVTALRDLARYVDWRVEPRDTMKIVEARKVKLAASVIP